MENRKKEIFIILTVLIIQTIIYVLCGIQKSYIHMDEAYSMGLTHYERVEIQDNTNFYNQWHNKTYYEQYLSVQEDESNDYRPIYENQKNDVHPPLYYLLLRLAMNFTKNHFSKWPGIILNILIYLFITLFTYQILKKLFASQTKSKEKAIALAFISSISIASLTNVIYIRMYALSTLNILITTFLHMKLLEEEKINMPLFLSIGISALVGSLTHYYYLLYLGMLYIVFALKYLRQRHFKKFMYYTLTMLITAVISLTIFPYSIQHMFFGYRGQGVIYQLSNLSKFLINILLYLWKISYYGFHNLLWIILILLLSFILYKKSKRIVSTIPKNKYIMIIAIPTMFYFLIVAMASPWIELRYMLPIYPLLFILVIYGLFILLNSIRNKKITMTIFSILLLLFLLTPIIFKIEPEVLYRDKKEIVQQLENEFNLPTLYLLNTSNNRFLDDIFLFSKIEESYIAKDLDDSVDAIKSILNGKDISNGIVVFINEGYSQDTLLKRIHQATSLKKCRHLKRLNACDVYYFH